MSPKQAGTARPFPAVLFQCSILALVLSLALFRFFFADFSDPHHCKALATEGRWLDSKQWQPEGCMLAQYKPKMVKSCFEGRKVVFVGDSVVRNVFYGAAKQLDPSVSTIGEKHSNRDILVDDIKFSFIWDPFLNSTGFQDILNNEHGLDAPSMLVVGSGLWYLRYPESTGGTSVWQSRVDNVFDALERSKNIADQVVLLPVEIAVEELLSPERKATIHNKDVKKMNKYIEKKMEGRYFERNGNSLYGFVFPKVFNEVVEHMDQETEDGLHFSESISATQARILLNLRCNDALPKSYPFDKTCCNSYPLPNWVQALAIIALAGYGPLAIWLVSRQPGKSYSFFPPAKFFIPLAVFGLSLVFIFAADRTPLFLKENKQYNAFVFGILCLLALAAGMMTMKPAEKDLGFLNRDQTDEWKGWMQIAILIYHYLGASKISGIYNPIRVTVAAYLFQTGYGHLTFFLKKADFSFARVAGVLVRLNLLTIVLTYLMNTDYLSYYFSPLVTMWFFIIWITMYVGHSHNNNTAFLVTKLAVSAVMTAAFFMTEGPLEYVFGIFNNLFATNWNATEWRFRVTLDIWVVWAGAFTALAFIKIKELRIPDRPDWEDIKKWSIIGSGVAMAGFFLFELMCESKFTYNHYHPYVSIVTVLAFCILRNATVWLRSTSSTFFIFFGKCSLETFIIQFHLFIAGDTKGIIMMIPGGSMWRPLNFIVTSIVFVFVSNQVSTATGALTEWICSTGESIPLAREPQVASPPPQPEATEKAATETVSIAVPVANTSDSSVGAIKYESPSSKLTTLAKRDLRVKFLLIFLGLWVINIMYPKSG